MAWTLSTEQLCAELDELSKRVSGRGAIGFEKLARGHRWLDRHDEAERWFRKAADDLLEVEAAGRRDTRSRVWTGGLLTLAGASGEAEPWLRRALDSSDLEPEDRAGAHYLLGEHLDAVLAAPGSVPAHLAAAVRERDPAPLAADRARLLELLRSRRAGPIQVAIGKPLTEWDWIEESFVTEARLRSEDPPSHEQMLAQLGLDGDSVPQPEIELVPGARAEVVREDESGDPVETTIAVDGELVLAVLHPQPARYVKVAFFDDGRGWVAKWLQDPEDDEGMYITDRVDTFAEAVQRAGEWLAVSAPDPPGGAYATAALADLVAALSRS